MNVVNINGRACEHYRKYFDAYLDNEVRVGSRHLVLQHLCFCRDCAGILESRNRMKQLMRNAVSREVAPAELRIALRNHFRAEQSGFFLFNTARWTVALVLILSIGLVRALDGEVLPTVLGVLPFRL